MNQLTEEQKRERRRLKRQQRILQSAGDRLERITGTAHGYSPSPSPSSSTSSLRAIHTSTSQHSLRSFSSVQDFQGDKDDMASLLRRRTFHESPSTSSSSAPPMPGETLGASPTGASASPDLGFLNDLVSPSTSSTLRQRQPSLSSTPSPALDDGLSGHQPPPMMDTSHNKQPSLLNTLMMRKLYRQTRYHQLDPTLKYWNLLHFISMLWLTVCALYNKSSRLDSWPQLLREQNVDTHHYPLLGQFLLLEALLYIGFRLYHPKDAYPEPEDDFTLIASRLAAPYKQIIYTILDHRRTLFCLFQDLSIVVFLIGFSQVLTHLL
ncbi:hypothetical protein DM01DRAFT_1332252 [Hesseltinella vesiculosa]|uniref:Uncharacterized protein n=1 Tax=Hesseltinella vesiculosa TaxID=101127 RepID=A0A1X2GUK3_9FUNG|nr:hypothetical protein DM01DRAFT_1332252 [Hesseltinella vesiculosa]